MAKNKTTQTEQSVDVFVDAVDDSLQRADSRALIKLMREVSGQEPKMWGSSIIGFGRYHYRYASGHEGDAPLLGFSPRKAAISLYVFTGSDEHLHLLDELGKFKKGKACIYIKRLSDIDTAALSRLMKETIRFLRSTYPGV